MTDNNVPSLRFRANESHPDVQLCLRRLVVLVQTLVAPIRRIGSPQRATWDVPKDVTAGESPDGRAFDTAHRRQDACLHS